MLQREKTAMLRCAPVHVIVPLPPDDADSVFTPSREIGAVELVDACANHFKHGTEWRGPWKQLEGQQGATAEVLLSAGLGEHSTGTLRSAAVLLGNPA